MTKERQSQPAATFTAKELPVVGGAQRMETRKWGGKQRRGDNRQAWCAEARGSPGLLSVWATPGDSVTDGGGVAQRKRDKVRQTERSTAKRPKLECKYQRIGVYILVSNQANIFILRNAESGFCYTVFVQQEQQFYDPQGS